MYPDCQFMFLWHDDQFHINMVNLFNVWFLQKVVTKLDVTRKSSYTSIGADSSIIKFCTLNSNYGASNKAFRQLIVNITPSKKVFQNKSYSILSNNLTWRKLITF
jgi:hypothetical protein